jgi:DNA-binding NtrC family response regulator
VTFVGAPLRTADDESHITMPGAARILVVDDDPALLRALPDTIRLRFSDAVVETAPSAEAGLELVRKEPYDVIITDLVMPGQSGVWLMDEMLKLQLTPAVILMTAHLNPIGYSQKGGAFSFVRKPIDRQEFLRSLQSAIQFGQTRRRIATNDSRSAGLDLRAQELTRIRKKIQEMQKQVQSMLDQRYSLWKF